MKQSGTTNTLQRLVRRLTADAHEDEAEALKTVDALMREYAFTRDPLTPDAEQFANDLRRLVADWMCASPELAGSALLHRLRQHEAMMAPHQKDRETGRLFVAATAEIARLIDLCARVHDRLLRGDENAVLLEWLAEGWQGTSNPTCAKKAGAGIGVCAMPPSPGYCAARMDNGRCGAAPFRDCQPCEHLRLEAGAGV
jgi:hypothetical protein